MHVFDSSTADRDLRDAQPQPETPGNYRGRARSLANLAEHYRRKGDAAKAALYAQKAEDLAAKAQPDQTQHAAPAEGDAGSDESHLSHASHDSQDRGIHWGKGRPGQPAPSSPPPAHEPLQLDEATAGRVLGLLAAGQHAILLERYADHPNPAVQAACTAALLRDRDLSGAARLLARLPDTEENRLKRASIPLLAELARPLDAEPRVHLIILAHNRADLLPLALAELARTEYTNYAVYLADNGSADTTWDALQQAAHAFPEHIDVYMERLPTNIGRPAGHNWLLARFDHSAADYIAIGDDDLIRVPPTWLADMVKTARLFPKAGAVGGKALNPNEPGQAPVIHGGVRRLEAFEEQRLRISNEGLALDFGQFDYIDRVDHVIACLMLYTAETLLAPNAPGLFDIRFSPCQLVDIEHHLRMRLAGQEIVYNGFIAFEHMRAMGRKAGSDRALIGNSTGNVVKLLSKYEPRQVQALIARETARRLGKG